MFRGFVHNSNSKLQLQLETPTITPGPLSIKKAEHARSFIPLDDKCQCFTCKNHTRAYLHHLFKANEPMASTLLVLHNIQHMQDKMRDMREAILRDEI